jgi:hypothetical protein
MSEFTPSNPQLDAAISQRNDPEQIRELTKASLAAQGIISRERGNEYGSRLLRIRS